MAISDVLSESANQIRQYLERHPQMYVETKDEVEALLAQMDALRGRLDFPPFLRAGEAPSGGGKLQGDAG